MRRRWASTRFGSPTTSSGARRRCWSRRRPRRRAGSPSAWASSIPFRCTCPRWRCRPPRSTRSRAGDSSWAWAPGRTGSWAGPDSRRLRRSPGRGMRSESSARCCQAMRRPVGTPRAGCAPGPRRCPSTSARWARECWSWQATRGGVIEHERRRQPAARSRQARRLRNSTAVSESNPSSLNARSGAIDWPPACPSTTAASARTSSSTMPRRSISCSPPPDDERANLGPPRAAPHLDERHPNHAQQRAPQQTSSPSLPTDHRLYQAAIPSNKASPRAPMPDRTAPTPPHPRARARLITRQARSPNLPQARRQLALLLPPPPRDRSTCQTPRTPIPRQRIQATHSPPHNYPGLASPSVPAAEENSTNACQIHVARSARACTTPRQPSPPAPTIQALR